MDGQTQSSADRSRSDRTGPLLLLALFALVLPLRVWLLCHTEVTARDSIGFINYAHLLDVKPWAEVVCSEHQHPGYPFAIWAVSKPLRAIGGDTAETMQLSAQLVSLIASLLLAAVMFGLGTRLWNQYVGFWGALLFQYLPGSGHHLSDGISEAMFLLCVASALYLFIRGMQTRRTLGFALGGACVGLAYLTRPEGLLVIGAFGLLWLGWQLSARTRWSWRPWLGALTAATAACILVGSVYVLTTGKLSIKPNADLADHAFFEESSPVLFASVWASNFVASNDLRVQFGQALRALVFEFGQGFHYFGCIPLIWACLFCGRRLAARPEFWLLPLYFTIHAVALVYLGMKANYVSERHVLPMVMLGCYPCVIGVVHFAELLVGLWSRLRHAEPSQRATLRLGAVLMVPLLAFCLTKTVQPLHANRVGNREAGRWLAQHVHEFDVIEDEHRWSYYYSGIFFRKDEKDPPILPADAQPKCFTVVTRWIAHGGVGVEAQIRDKRERELSDSGQLVYHWPADVSAEKARIVVYETPRNPATHAFRRAERAIDAQPASRNRE